MKYYLLLFTTLLVITLMWNQPLIYPIKLLIVFFHESSHALMTVATGGEVIELVVDKQQGGQVISAGGSRFLTLTAGYLGSMLWGVVIYLLAVGSRFDNWVMLALGTIILIIAFAFVRDTFALGFAVSTGVVMLILGWRANEQVNDFLLRVIGLSSILYVPLDIISDTIMRSNLRSDAYMMAEEFGGMTVMWGGAWLVASLVIAAFTLRMGHAVEAKHPLASATRSAS